jgi:hypothetical protein
MQTGGYWVWYVRYALYMFVPDVWNEGGHIMSVI